MSDAPPPDPPPIDWAARVPELQAMAEASLGNRAQKVKDLLAAADPSEPGISAAIDEISRTRLMLVDPERLKILANQMRARVGVPFAMPPAASSGTRVTLARGWSLVLLIVMLVVFLGMCVVLQLTTPGVQPGPR